MQLLAIFLLALAIATLSMPLILFVAKRHGLYDEVNERKIHTGNIPRLGGVGIVLAFLATMGGSALIFGLGGGTGGRLWGILASLLTVHLLGLVDDFRNLRAKLKFAIEFLLALLLIGLGFRFKTIIVPFASGSIDLGLLSWPLTLIWIIGVTNAVNLIDGMDGLAGGISFLASMIYGAVFIFKGDMGAALVCLALAGAIGGFLVFNLPPAKIFMGDSGSLALGFILSILPLMGPATDVIEIGFVSAVTVLLIPIYDTFAAMIRRWRKGVSFFTPDKLHLHHKLLSLGLGTRGVLAVVYSAQLFLGAAALSPLYMSATASFALRIGTWILYAGLFCLLSILVRRRDEAAGLDPKKHSGDAASLSLKTSLLGEAFNEGGDIR